MRVMTARRALRRSALLTVVLVATLALSAGSAGAETTTPTTTTGSRSVIDLGSTGQFLFVVLIVVLFSALWFALILYDRISANKRLATHLPKLLAEVKSTKEGEGLSAAEVRALARQIREAPKGTPGLTRTMIALGLLTLVCIALAALLVGPADVAGDLLKTVVTALTTALATVLGFYFGAKTASEASAPGGGRGQGPGGAPTAPTAPGPPTNVAAVAGDGQAEVSFEAPADTGGSPITRYTVTSTPPGITGEGDASPIVVTGLENGTQYTFTVRARNEVAEGPESAASNPVTPQP